MKIIPLYQDINLNQYFHLLNQLSPTNISKNSKQHFIDYLNNLPKNIKIFLLIDNDEIVSSGTIIIEPKIIHNFGLAAHIEDVVVTNKYRGKGYGKKIINYLIDIAKKEKCYKVILNCKKELCPFYSKNGFQKKNEQMAIYF